MELLPPLMEQLPLCTDLLHLLRYFKCREHSHSTHATMETPTHTHSSKISSVHWMPRADPKTRTRESVHF